MARKLSVREAAEVAGCSRRHINTSISNGQIKATKKRGPWYKGGFVYEITRAEVQKFKRSPLRKGSS